MKDPIKLFKALSDDTRLEMVKFLLKKKELSCQEISMKFPLSQPAISYHFSELADAGIVTTRKVGKARFYKINKELFQRAGVNLPKLLQIS